MEFPVVLLVLYGCLVLCVQAVEPFDYRDVSFSGQLTDDCEQSVVGGGWSGLYFAYRLATSNLKRAKSLCVFEGTNRLGGRTYSVRIEGTEFTLDVGAYRFAPDMHLPGDLILDELGIPTECYEPGCPSPKVDFPAPFSFNYSEPLRRIVDPASKLPGGYETALRKLAQRLKRLGAKIFLETKLTDIEVRDFPQSSRLTFSGPNGQSVAESKLVLLNLPRQHMFSLPSVPTTMDKRVADMLKCVAFDLPESLFPNATNIQDGGTLTKAYVYYKDAWWVTKLRKTQGNFPVSGFQPLATSYGIYFLIHWGDGPTSCRAEGGAEASECHGFLEVYYSVSNETFFSSIPADLTDPLGTLDRSDGSPSTAAALDTMHAALTEAVGPFLREAGVSANDLPSPEMIVVGVWRRPDKSRPIGEGLWYTSPTKVYWSPEVSGSPADACGVPGMTEEEYRATLLQPWGLDAAVFLANNDYYIQDVRYIFGDWAEDSLLQAERALRRIGVGRPEWLNATYYQEKVAGMDTDAASPVSMRGAAFPLGRKMGHGLAFS
uniref:Amine oxidase domain-containing protein n=1 Tax=Tetraselmis sp. GSL018 TaxID=582737 RepID=A0A061QWZ9_9CHLO|mmetsp:Transcript_8920/g.21503  ORF Transcript_8920/g.21503 Transcript_8920/m.21503 type:complete len:546 (+) Transcript_8920:57-1694(+)